MYKKGDVIHIAFFYGNPFLYTCVTLLEYIFLPQLLTMKPIRLKEHSLLLMAILFSTYSCKNDAVIVPTVNKSWSQIEMRSAYEIPAPTGRTEEGEIEIQILSDNSLKYSFHIHNLTPGDAITAAHIHLGDAGHSGPVYINLAPIISGSGEVTGKVTGLTQGQIDTISNQPVYVNVHSTQVPSGLVRAQLDKEVKFAMDIPLSGLNEVPAVITTATGLCILRLTDDKVLYSNITVNNLESNDTLRVAHLHKAAAGKNGPVRIFLASTIDDFGVMKSATLVDSLYNMVLTDSMYANAHTKLRGSGLVRGQLK